MPRIDDTSELSSSYNTHSTSISPGRGNKRDVSQFVKYLLEGSGVDENSVDFAALRKELEDTIEQDRQEFDAQISKERKNLSKIIDKEKRNDEKEKTEIPVRSESHDQNPEIETTKIDIGSIAGIAAGEHTDLETEAIEAMDNIHAERIDAASTAALKGSASSLSGSYEQSFKQSLEQLVADSNISIDIPKWDSLNIPIPTAVPSISIETMSHLLQKAGFPPFPSHLFSANPNSWSDQQLLMKALYWALENVVQEYSLKASLCNHLSKKLQDLSHQSSKLSEFFDQMKRDYSKERQKLQEELDFQKEECRQLKKTLFSANDHEQQMSETLTTTTLEIQKLKEKYRRVNEELEREKQKSASLYDDLQMAKEGEIRAKSRAKELITRVCSHPVNKRPLPVSKDVYDIIMYYEQQLQSFDKELDHLRQGEDVPERVKVIVEEGDVSDRMRMALLDEIRELRDELEQITSAFDQVQEDNEILRLKLLAANEKNTGKENRRSIPTRELIRRDKEKYQRKLMNIEILEEAEVKQILGEICEKLKLDQISQLVDSLDDIAKTISLIPQMQDFIQKVDVVVWSAPKVVESFKKGDLLDEYFSKTPHKLSETLARLVEWRKIMETDLKQLLIFKGTVCKLMNVLEDDSELLVDGGSMKKCVTELKKRLVNNFDEHVANS